MISLPEKSDCSGCGACHNICPVNAIKMRADEEGFVYPVIDNSICVKCNKCNNVCPSLIERSQSDTEETKAYWAINIDEKIRSESSSGGVFSVLAEKTLENGGIVFGAAMSDDMRSVNHIFVKNEDHMYKLRGSKYIQSDIADTYRTVRKYLNKNVEVLFSGTPCQVEGLLSFLGKDYENLFCVDFICHGVPSVKVWNKYVDFIEGKHKSKTKSVNFRSKMYGWHLFSVSISFENEIEYTSKPSNDLFIKTFSNNICLRPSCYECKFKKINRQSDITLADFWGVEKLIPEIDDDKGISFIMVHSEKGRYVLESIKNRIRLGEVDIDLSLKYNSAAIKSVTINKNRKYFFKNLEKKDFDILVNKYAKPTLYRRIRGKFGKLKRLLKNV